MPRGTASRWKTRYAVQLSVPRRGGWRAWGAVRADFECALAGAADPAVASAEIASELRRGADYVRVSVAVTVITSDVADALAIAWDAFCSASRDDPGGWEVAAATAQVRPEPPLTGASDHTERRPSPLDARLPRIVAWPDLVTWAMHRDGSWDDHPPIAARKPLRPRSDLTAREALPR